MTSEQWFQDIFDKYSSSKRANYIFLDSNFYNKGINYKKYLPIYYNIINNKEISEQYTKRGWFIYCYLLANSIHNQYITTTINIIATDLKIKPYLVKESLLLLQELNKLSIYKNNINKATNNDKLEIALSYIHEYKDEGFVKLPIDYIKAILNTINDTQWAIFSVLCVRYNYIYPSSYIDKNTGNEVFYTQENCYAFPTQEQIADIIGVKDYQTISRQAKELQKNKYHIITICESKINDYEEYYDNNNKHKIKRYNCIYKIPLFERIEYNYYYYYISKDYREGKEEYRNFFKKLKKYGYTYLSESKDNWQLNKIDYIKYCYKNSMQDYQRAIENLDCELYESVKNNRITKIQ